VEYFSKHNNNVEHQPVYYYNVDYKLEHNMDDDVQYESVHNNDVDDNVEHII
jgi:hypothetical protein